MATASQIMESWPKESREAAQLVLKAHGEPDELTDTQLLWYRRAPWKRIVVTRTYYPHDFPMPHIDCVESFIDYRVPVDKFNELAEFDGSVICQRTAGEVSARCHDLEANFLALNLMHDIVTGAKTARAARDYYANEVLNYRRRMPTPYMHSLRFTPKGPVGDRDTRLISDDELGRAIAAGRAHA